MTRQLSCFNSSWCQTTDRLGPLASPSGRRGDRGLKGYSWHTLHSKPLRIKRGQWLNMRVDFQGTTVTVYVDGSRIISVEDAFYDRGKVGLRAFETQVFVDDFELISLPNP
jgi:hypothetical protein